MNCLSYSPDENDVLALDKDILAMFRSRNKPEQIRPDMSSKQIADLISDRLMEVVRNEFDKTSKLKDR